MESKENTKGRVCSLCGKSFGGKASLKRHKKKCKAIFAARTKECPWCEREVLVETFDSEHRRNCETLSKHMNEFNAVRPIRTHYIGDLRPRTISSGVMLELLKVMGKREKLTKFQNGQTLVYLLVNDFYNLECIREALKGLTLVDEIVRPLEVFGRRHSVFELITNNPSEFDVDILQYLLDNLPMDKRPYKMYLDFFERAHDATPELLETMLTGAIFDENFPMKICSDIVRDCLKYHSTYADELILLIWNRLTDSQKSNFRINENHMFHTITSLSLLMSHPLKVSTYEKLTLGRGIEAGQSYTLILDTLEGDDSVLKPKKENIAAPPIPAEFPGQVKKFLYNWFNVFSEGQISRQYILNVNEISHILTLSLNEIRGYTNVVGKLIECGQMGRFWDYGQLIIMYLTSDHEFYRDDLVVYCRSQCQYSEVFTSSDALFAYGEAQFLLSNETKDRERICKWLIDRFLKDDNSEASKLSHTSRLFDLVSCGTVNCTPQSKLQLSRLPFYVSRQSIKEYTVNDPFLIDCLKHLKTNKKFFEAEYRVKLLIEKAEQMVSENKLEKAIEYYWKAAVSCIDECKKQSNVTLKNWCEYTAKFQKEGNLKFALKSAHLGALMNLDNPDRFVIFFARSKIYRAMGHLRLAAMDLSFCLELQPDLIEATFEYGVCMYLLERYTIAIAYFVKCLKINNGHVGSANAIRNIIDDCQNKEIFSEEVLMEMLGFPLSSVPTKLTKRSY
eukprot:TRINITY_DN778302_c0_g1_i1.p1 TRINITY_DN778302_c0_g1~~TRINITY_DN778302_c0_g1_i1.p1  ORF type:complete len:732 (-),score=107.89 TRINITY_DN778302_c0_g1_i1:291-2486(-)